MCVEHNKGKCMCSVGEIVFTQCNVSCVPACIQSLLSQMEPYNYFMD